MLVCLSSLLDRLGFSAAGWAMIRSDQIPRRSGLIGSWRLLLSARCPCHTLSVLICQDRNPWPEKIYDRCGSFFLVLWEKKNNKERERERSWWVKHFIVQAVWKCSDHQHDMKLDSSFVASSLFICSVSPSSNVSFSTILTRILLELYLHWIYND